MINPKDLSKWMRGSIVLQESPKNSWGCDVLQIKFALHNMLCGTLVLCAESSQMLAFGLSLEIRRGSVLCPYLQQSIEQRAGVAMWGDGS